MYSIFNPRGEKIADCGILRDAVNLVNMRNNIWDGHYYQFKPDYQTIDVEPLSQNQLPTKDIIINMNSGVGGLWREVQLPNTQQEPLDL